MLNHRLTKSIKAELSRVLWRSQVAPYLDDYLTNKELRSWSRSSSSGAAPALVKRALLRTLAAQHSCSTFVETGTCLGGTTYALRNDFERIITIELDEKLYQDACHRLKRFPHICVREGDSASLLPVILEELQGPTLFFLDGHHSGGATAKGWKETPIVEELRAILEKTALPKVVVVDDVRCFDGTRDYPTLDELKNLIREIAPDTIFSTHPDMLVLVSAIPRG